MAAPFQPNDLDKLKKFIKFVDENPAVLNMPQLIFVKEFIEKFGGKIPEAEAKMPAGGGCPFGGGKMFSDESTSKGSKVDEVESEESELELDMEGVIEPDFDTEHSMGDISKEPTEDEITKSGELRAEAFTKYSEQKYEEAIKCYTDAIILNPTNALFYAKRGQTFLKLNKPNCCVRDCNRALQLNCDSAAAYKFRGRAYRLLGNWIEAAKDLRQACKLDFDEEADEWLREVTPNAKKIEQHELKKQRKEAERERKAKEAGAQQRRQQQKPAEPTKTEAMNMSDILSGINDPEVMSALQDILKNPANMDKYKSNPKIWKLIEAVKGTFPAGMAGAGAGMPTGFPGGFPGGFPAGFGAAGGPTESSDTSNATTNPSQSETKPTPKKVPDFVDDGLD